jgi:hypothetical protein
MGLRGLEGLVAACWQGFKRFQMFNGLAVMFGFGRFGRLMFNSNLKSLISNH